MATNFVIHVVCENCARLFSQTKYQSENEWFQSIGSLNEMHIRLLFVVNVGGGRGRSIQLRPLYRKSTLLANIRKTF